VNEVRVYRVQGGEEQLKEVWEESDGLNKKDFDPRTFFYLHGLLLSWGIRHSVIAWTAAHACVYSLIYTHTHIYTCLCRSPVLAP